MLSSVAALLFGASSIVAAQSPYPPFSGDPFKKYEISANGINASFIPYGARLTNLYVNDKNGVSQDVVVGYDEGSQYLEDTVSYFAHSSFMYLRCTDFYTVDKSHRKPLYPLTCKACNINM